MAAKMPAGLKRLLHELGFRFEYPVVGRLETGQTAQWDFADFPGAFGGSDQQLPE